MGFLLRILMLVIILLHFSWPYLEKHVIRLDMGFPHGSIYHTTSPPKISNQLNYQFLNRSKWLRYRNQRVWCFPDQLAKIDECFAIARD